MCLDLLGEIAERASVVCPSADISPMQTPYDRLQDLREAAAARHRAALAQARHEREKAMRLVAAAESETQRALPEAQDVAHWQVADAAQARSLLMLHQAEECLREKEAALVEVSQAHVVAMRDEKIVARMKERFLASKNEQARRQEDRNIDDFNATKLFRQMNG